MGGDKESHVELKDGASSQTSKHSNTDPSKVNPAINGEYDGDSTDSDFNDKNKNILEKLEADAETDHHSHLRDFVSALKFSPESLEIDKPAHMHDKIGKHKGKNWNKDMWVDNYASRFELPASFVLNAHAVRTGAKGYFF